MSVRFFLLEMPEPAFRLRFPVRVIVLLAGKQMAVGRIMTAWITANSWSLVASPPKSKPTSPKALSNPLALTP